MRKSIVLNFHGIGTPQRALDPGEAPYWVSIDQFTSMLDAVVQHPNRSNIGLTFDDGNKSDRTIALPLLQERGLTADFFVLTGRLGKEGSLDPMDVRALRDTGMGIGSHGIDHLDWSQLDPEALSVDLSKSKARLEDICGMPVTMAGIPFGLYNARVLRALRATGYEIAYSSDRGPMRPGDFPRPRTSVRGDWSSAEMTAALSGRMSVLKRLRRMVGMTYKRFSS